MQVDTGNGPEARCFISPYLEKSKTYYSIGQGTASYAIGWVAG